MDVEDRPERAFFYGLGVVTEPLGFHVLIGVEKAEYEEILAAANELESLATTPFHFSLLESNYRQLMNSEQFLRVVLGLGREVASPDRRQVTSSSISATVNWLTSMRLYLDHEETHVKRTFGSASEECNRMTRLRAQVFDSHVGYRFCYRFRNYVQHCGLPLSGIDFSPPADGSGLKQHAAVYLSRDELLSSFDGWGPVADDLRSFAPRFDLMPLVAEAMAGLRSLEADNRDRRLDRALASVDVVHRAVGRIGDQHGPDGHPTLFRVERLDDDDDRLGWNPTRLDPRVVELLVAVRDGSRSRESVWTRKVVQVPISFEQEEVRSRFSTSSAGVEVLCAFLAEGGPTQEFIDLVNQLAVKYGDTKHLISGLINVSLLLAHLAAGALNTTAETLIAGLNGPYPEARPLGEQTEK